MRRPENAHREKQPRAQNRALYKTFAARLVNSVNMIHDRPSGTEFALNHSRNRTRKSETRRITGENCKSESNRENWTRNAFLYYIKRESIFVTRSRYCALPTFNFRFFRRDDMCTCPNMTVAELFRTCVSLIHMS